MKKSSNRILAIAMCICMICGMMPMAAHAAETTYTITYTDGVGGTVFADQVYTVEEGGAFPYFDTTKGSLEREGYTYEGWTPDLVYTVTADATYTAVWSACEGHPTHSWYESDGTNHWSVCACGYILPDSVEAHSWEWKFNDEYHWQVCECLGTTGEEVGENAAHSYSGDTDTSCDCGYTRPIETHTHTWEWTYDSSLHWQVCGDPDCGESSTAAQAHQFDNDADALCDICGYTRTVEHTHSWGKYESNGDGSHTRICTTDSSHRQKEDCGGTATCHELATCPDCGVSHGEYNKNNHVGGTEIRNAVAAGEFTDGYTGDTYCLGCGDLLSKGESIPATHVHSYTLKYNGNHHWDECSCGDTRNLANHIAGVNDSDCNYCGYHVHFWSTRHNSDGTHTMTCKFDSSHVEIDTTDYGYYLNFDKTTHWQLCNRCGKVDSNWEYHVYDGDSDPICNTCGYRRENSTHAHRYTIANCASPSVCSCGVTSGAKNPNNHTGGTEIRNAVEATRTEKGYTGDTYCKGCGSMIGSGEEIPAKGFVAVKIEDDANVKEVTFITAEGVELPEDAEVIVEDHTPSADNLDFVLGIDADTEYLDADDVNVSIVEDDNYTAPDGTKYSMYEIILINDEEYYIQNCRSTSDILSLMRLSDGATCSYNAATNVLDFTGSYDLPIQDYAYDKINIGGVTYDVKLSYVNDFGKDSGSTVVVLYYNGSPAAQLYDSLYGSEDCYFLEGFDPETLKAQQNANDLGTVTPGESPIDGLESGKTYNVSVIGSNDISVPGTENVGGTVTQTFDIPNELVGRTDVTFVAVHNTNPHATALAAAKFKMEEARADYWEYHGDSSEERQRLHMAAERTAFEWAVVQELYDKWEKEHAADTGTGNELGTVTIAEDGKTLTATYTVSSFSPFTVYAFVEADEPEIKTLSATIVDGSDDTTESVVSADPIPKGGGYTWVWIVVAILAAGAAVTIIVISKKKKK